MDKLELWLPFPKATITQGFNGNANPLYAGQGLRGHTAEDFGVSCGTPLPNCVDGAYCYSVLNRDNPDLSKYRAVFTLVEVGEHVYEVSYGHLDQIYAVPGHTYAAGDVLGTTGNTGDVYMGATAVTNAIRAKIKCAGGHLHGPQVRLCKKVQATARLKQYLVDGNGLYRHTDGSYIEVVNYDNGWNGCVDPENYFNGYLAINAPLVLGNLRTQVSLYQKLVQAALAKLGIKR